MEETFGVRPSVCFEVQKVIGVSVGNGNQRNYQVQWAPTWVSSFHLVGCEHLIEEFNQQESFEKDHLVNGIRTAVPDKDNSHLKNEVLENDDDVYDNDDDDSDDDDNVPNLNNGQQLTEIQKRSSMIPQGEYFFENQKSNSCLYSNNACDNVTVVIPLEENVSNGRDLHGSNQTNPNFEWVERRGDNTNSNVNGAAERTSLGSQHVAPHLHFRQEFINKERLEVARHFHNDMVEVKPEEIVLVQNPESDQACSSSQDYQNKQALLDKLLKLYKCNMCRKSFKKSGGLARHLVKAHGAGNITHVDRNVFVCSICDWKGESNASLLKHKSIHHGEMLMKKQYKCEVCDKLFSASSHLTRHMCTHTGHRAHKCNFCEKTFVRSSHLRRHIRLHTGERPFQCNVCDRTFNRKDIMQKHVLTHTETPGGIEGIPSLIQETEGESYENLLSAGSHSENLLSAGSHNESFLSAGSLNESLLSAGSHNESLLSAGSHNESLSLSCGSHI